VAPEPPRSGTLTAQLRQNAELEWLQGRVKHLEGMVDRLARIQPRPAWSSEDDDPTAVPEFHRHVVIYEIRLRVPDWPLLSIWTALGREFWEDPFGLTVFDELAHRSHQVMTEEVKKRRSL
jgi:hypothetical protein